MVSPIELVGTIITILLRIVELARTAKSYRRKCGLLEGRVSLIVRFLEELHKSPWMLDSATEIMLNELRDTTDRALALVKSCQSKRKLWNIFMSYKKAAKFAALQEQLTYIMQHFHIANRILMLNLNNQQFFMTVLEKLLLDGACKRLPQSVKEDLKSYISGLKNCDHMSPDAKRLLERIVSDLNCRATSDPSGGEDVGTSAASSLVRDVVSIANDILEAVGTVKLKKEDEFPLKKEDEVRQVKLKKEDEIPLKKEDEVRQVKLKKEDKVRQLARYAEQAIDLLQQLPVPASDTVSSLRDALGEGRDIVRQCIQQHTRSVQLVPRCGGGPGGSNSNDISSVLYRIEYYLQNPDHPRRCMQDNA